MKGQLKLVVLLVILAGFMSYSGCKKDNDPEPITQVQLNKLVNAWQIETVDLDGVDNTDYYADFSLQISGTNPSSFTYTTSSRPHYSSWPSSGKLSLVSTDATNTIIRDQGTSEELTLTYTVTDTKLELVFLYAGDPYNARTQNVVGEWTFVFTK